jgi:hypothetical protein
MTNQRHVNILKQGVEVWNTWRIKHYYTTPDLSGAYFSKVDLRGAYLVRTNLRETDFSGANLNWADLSEADLSGADLSGADLNKVDLSKAILSKTTLCGTDLSKSDLSETDLSGANLRGANLRETDLISTNFTNANLTGCDIFGISAWNVNLEGAIQRDLGITNYNEPKITVDNLEVAQFIYLLLNNQKIRDVINTITSKVVLIFGRFTKERKSVLDALRNELRNHNFSPVVFDFEPSKKRDLTETISILAHLSRFIIADLTDAQSISQELERIVPHLPSVPIQPILAIDATEYALFESYKAYPWVLPIYRYQNIDTLLASIKEHIIIPVEKKEQEKDEKKVLKEENRRLREEIEKLRGGK